MKIEENYLYLCVCVCVYMRLLVSDSHIAGHKMILLWAWRNGALEISAETRNVALWLLGRLDVQMFYLQHIPVG